MLEWLAPFLAAALIGLVAAGIVGTLQLRRWCDRCGEHLWQWKTVKRWKHEHAPNSAIHDSYTIRFDSVRLCRNCDDLAAIDRAVWIEKPTACGFGYYETTEAIITAATASIEWKSAGGDRIWVSTARKP